MNEVKTPEDEILEVGGQESAPEVVPEAEKPKPRRGRPRKNPELLTEEIPGKAPAASKPRKTAKGKGVDTEALAQQLVGVHQIVAMVSGIPEVQINEQEASHLAKGITAVCEVYDLSLDGKTGAALQLVAAAAMIYGPRIWAFTARVKSERAQSAAAMGAE